MVKGKSVVIVAWSRESVCDEILDVLATRREYVVKSRVKHFPENDGNIQARLNELSVMAAIINTLKQEEDE
jgi:hypothetical protein